MKKIGILFMALAFASMTTATAAHRTEQHQSKEAKFTSIEPMTFEYTAPLEVFDPVIVTFNSFTVTKGESVCNGIETPTERTETPRTYRQRVYINSFTSIGTNTFIFEPNKEPSTNGRQYITNRPERTTERITAWNHTNRYGNTKTTANRTYKESTAFVPRTYKQPQNI